MVNDPTTIADYREAPGDPAEHVVPVVSGGRIGTCTWRGDSGGPVYTIIDSGPAQGYITAKGIISGGSKAGSGICTQYFTDIRLAAKAFGGDIKKRKIT
ncbi:hypothetical protein [Nonomuraea sp. B19D2]|uniref:hypothetical protein n=1 Tax=Nonomuraea sp. B19D2 TaxID=3159561 RepID=UPI0032DA49CD